MSETGDHVLVGVSADGALRGRAARVTRATEELRTRQKLDVLGARVLGRALACLAVYPTSFKDDARVSVQWSGNGALRSVFAELRAPGDLRGYVKNPAAILWGQDPRGPKLGRGLLEEKVPGTAVRVLRQQETGGFSQGNVELTSGEVDEDLASYFEASEQVATHLRADAIVDAAGAITAAAAVCVQLLPHAHGVELPSLSAFNVADDPHTALQRLLGADARMFDVTPLRFACPCSRERAYAGLSLLPQEDVLELIVEKNGAEVRCDFCGEVYRFGDDEILKLVQSKAGSA